MTAFKKGDVFAHAKTLGRKVALKNPAKRTAPKKAVAPAKRRAPKKIVPKAAGDKYSIQVKKTPRGQWQAIGLGGSNLEAVKQVARMYANNYPNYSFQVV